MAKARAAEALWVWLDDPAFGTCQHVGTLVKGERGSVRFEYRREWLKNPVAFELDPALTLGEGSFYPAESNFGVFLDSCPDRWGQTLMRRRESIEAKEAGRAPRTLTAWDFLCGVQDFTRMGALRFSQPESTRFIADELRAAPPVARLAELQAVALELTRKNLDNLPQVKRWLEVLVAPGASLGGARPKANLIDEHGALWIAKFPSADDDRDVALWEKLVHDLAQACAISVPPARLARVGHGYHTFLTQRFDRNGAERRFFTSAMTLLGKTDQQEASYLELAEFIATFGAPEYLAADLRELFRRVAFNVAVGNRDDHLRNHGFIRNPSGWRLAPAYDLNVSTKRDEHALALDLDQHAPSLETVRETAAFYRLTAKEADVVVRQIVEGLADWRAQAKAARIPAVEVAASEHAIMAGNATSTS